MLCLRGSLLAVVLSLPVGGAWAQSPGAAPNPSFNLLNRATASVTAFFATPAGRSNWGRDRLDGHAVVAGGKVPVRLAADGNCIYDLRAVFADGRDEVQREVNVCKVDDVAVGEAQAHRLRLHNQGSVPVTEVLVRPAGGGHPVTNLSQGRPIAPGAEGEFDLPGSDCLFDLRVTFSTGQPRQKRGADLCKSPEQAVQ